MKKFRDLILLSCIIFIYGCESLPSLDDVLPDKRTTYKKSRDLPELEVPPDLTVTKGEYSSEIPSDKNESTSLNEFEKQRQMMKADDMILGTGDFDGEKWVALSGSAGDVWPKLQEFWKNNNYTVYLDDVELGVLETDWKETEKIRQKFKIFAESTESGGTMLFLSSERQELSEGDWLAVQPDKSAEENIINKINSYFNGGSLAVKNNFTKKPSSISTEEKEITEGKAQIRNDNEGKNYLEVNKNFNLVWDNTKQVMEQAGYFIENSDREKGIYSFRYFRSEEEQEEGFFSKLKFWGDDENEEGLLYQLSLTEVNDKTEITVLKEDGQIETGADAESILATIERLYNKVL